MAILRQDIYAICPACGQTSLTIGCLPATGPLAECGGCRHLYEIQIGYRELPHVGGAIRQWRLLNWTQGVQREH